jgi:hypothetical protein
MFTEAMAHRHIGYDKLRALVAKREEKRAAASEAEKKEAEKKAAELSSAFPNHPNAKAEWLLYAGQSQAMFDFINGMIGSLTTILPTRKESLQVVFLVTPYLSGIQKGIVCLNNLTYILQTFTHLTSSPDIDLQGINFPEALKQSFCLLSTETVYQQKRLFKVKKYS